MTSEGETKWLEKRLDQLETKMDLLLTERAERTGAIRLMKGMLAFLGLTSLGSLAAVVALWRQVHGDTLP